MTSPQFSLPYQVMYYDTDVGGVVHNLAYLRWVEEARTKMSAALGMDYITLAREKNQHCVLVHHDVTYHTPALPFDNVVVNGWVERAENASIYFLFEIRRTTDNTLCVTVRQRLALVQMPQGRVLRIPKEWKALAAPSSPSAV
ncbi:MAG: acyl-CoA thioesterase [Akkermansia sp.]|nr:acyl-CoA thioesterase [Akkermansia sp.]